MIVALAVALAKEPDLIVLDEVYPFLHLETRSLVRQHLLDRVNKGAILVELHARPPDWVGEFDALLHLQTPNPSMMSPRDLWALRNSLPATVFSPLEKSMLRLEASLGLLQVPYPRDPATAAASVRGASLRAHLPPDLAESAGSMGADSAAVVLEITNLTFHRPPTFRLGPVVAAARRGDIVAVLGKNGAGKTTLLKALASLVEPIIGDVVVTVSGTTTRPPARRRRHLWARRVLYCSQDPDDQIYHATVREEILSTAKASGRSVSPDALHAAASMFCLDARLSDSPLDLPFSLRRLVLLAAALLARPPVLLLDEPTAGLDAVQVAAVTDAVRAFAHGGGTVFLISHDPDFWGELANRVLLLDAGQVAWSGPAAHCHRHVPAHFLGTTARVGLALGLPSFAPTPERIASQYRLAPHSCTQALE